MNLKHFNNPEVAIEFALGELTASLRDDLADTIKNDNDIDRENDLRDQIDDLEAIAPNARYYNLHQPNSNAEVLLACMEFMNPMAQLFIMDAVRKMADAVTEADPAKLAESFKNVPVSSAAWQGVAKEIKDKLDQFYNRGGNDVNA